MCVFAGYVEFLQTVWTTRAGFWGRAGSFGQFLSLIRGHLKDSKFGSIDIVWGQMNVSFVGNYIWIGFKGMISRISYN